MRTPRQSWALRAGGGGQAGCTFWCSEKGEAVRKALEERFNVCLESRKPAIQQLVEEHLRGKQLRVLSCCCGRLLAVVRKFLVMVSIVFACRGCKACSLVRLCLAERSQCPRW